MPLPFKFSVEEGSEERGERTSTSSPFTVQVLFHTVHVGSDKRGAALLKALQASFLHPAQVDDEGKRQPAWREEGYLKQLVKSLRIDVMEREVDLGKKQGASGVFPSDIEALAAALPDM